MEECIVCNTEIPDDEKADVVLMDLRKFRGKTNGETNAYVTLFTILHLIKSLNEENLVINI